MTRLLLTIFCGFSLANSASAEGWNLDLNVGPFEIKEEFDAVERAQMLELSLSYAFDIDETEVLIGIEYWDFNLEGTQNYSADEDPWRAAKIYASGLYSLSESQYVGGFIEIGRGDQQDEIIHDISDDDDYFDHGALGVTYVEDLSSIATVFTQVGIADTLSDGNASWEGVQNGVFARIGGFWDIGRGTLQADLSYLHVPEYQDATAIAKSQDFAQLLISYTQPIDPETTSAYWYIEGVYDEDLRPSGTISAVETYKTTQIKFGISIPLGGGSTSRLAQIGTPNIILGGTAFVDSID